jgi:membrane dipeptidase
MAEMRSFVSINAFGPFLTDGTPTVESYVDHLEHAMSIVGPDHVGLGTDFIDDVAAVVDPVFTGLLVKHEEIPTTTGLQRPADFPGLAAAVEKRLGAETAAKVLATNLIDFVGANIR